jgi:hypothetical protein
MEDAVPVEEMVHLHASVTCGPRAGSIPDAVSKGWTRRLSPARLDQREWGGTPWPEQRSSRHPGGPEQFRIVDMEVGDPGPGQIRIRHEACGLNFIDVYQRTGLYPLQMPHAMGMEAAGVIEAVGEGVTHLKVGDRAAYAAHRPAPIPKPAS